MSLVLEGYKNTGAIALSIFWLAVLVIIRLRKGEKAKSISEYVASAKKIAVLFGGVALVSTVLLVLFFVKWFTPTFQLGILFNLVVVTMLLLFAVAGLVPDTKGIQHKIHINAAVMASLLLLPAMLLMIINDYISQVARMFTILASFTMLYAGYKFAASRHTQNQLLVYEAVYFLCFDVSVLMAAYVR
jgi:hypothetical protein